MLVLDPDLVRTRITATVPVFKFVGLAADLGKVTAKSVIYPSAYVVPLGETAGENRYQMGDVIEQTIVARIAVIMAVRDLADRSGAAAATSLKPLREALMLSLGAYVPIPGEEALRFARGALQSGIDATAALFWQDDYTLRFTRRIQIT